MEQVKRFIQQISGDNPLVMRWVFILHYSVLMMSTGAGHLIKRLVLRRESATASLVLAAIAGIGIGNVIYMIHTLFNVGYCVYWMYGLLKHVATGTVSWGVSPVAKALQCAAGNLNCSRQLSHASQLLTDIIEATAIRGAHGIVKTNKRVYRAARQSVENIWHIYNYRESYDYYNVAQYNQFAETELTQDGIDTDTIHIARIYTPVDQPFEILSSHVSNAAIYIDECSDRYPLYPVLSDSDVDVVLADEEPAVEYVMI